MVGDSITAGGRWQDAFADVAVENWGVSGDTSLDVAARLAPIEAGRPDLVLLMLGINDLLRGGDPALVADRHGQIRRQLQRGGRTRVIVQSTLACEASHCGPAMVERVRRLNQLLRRHTPPGDYLDVDAVLSDATGLRRQYSLDGLHLNAAGYARWQALLRQRLPLLGGHRPVR